MKIPSLTIQKISGTPVEVRALDAIFKSLSAETAQHLGNPTADDELKALPPGIRLDQKYYFLCYNAQNPIGCVEIIRGFPEAHKANIGLMAIHAQWQGKGFGKSFWSLTEKEIATWKEISRLRLGVSEGNVAATLFWQKMGFVATGERKIAVNTNAPVPCLMFEKPQSY